MTYRTLTRKKIRAGEYALFDGDKLIAYVSLTGRPGVDNYPWEWHLVENIDIKQTTGRADALWAARDTITHLYYNNRKRTP